MEKNEFLKTKPKNDIFGCGNYIDMAKVKLKWETVVF